MYTHSYDTLLALFSVLVAMLASYTALDLVSRQAAAKGRAALMWLSSGSAVMGLGIWSMHFVGMLAFKLPIPLGYDLFLTLTSLLIAIGASGVALRIACMPTLPRARLVFGALLMGCAISGMHYTGMAAMRMHPAIDYDPRLFVLSIVIAVLACGAALWIAFHLRQRANHTHHLRLAAAAVMGLAIAAMHYTAMAAARFPAGSVCSAAGTGLAGESLALPILVITICVLSMALLTSMLDLRLEMRTSLLSDSLTAATEELNYLLLHDNLTKLPNQALLEDRFTQSLAAAARSGTRLAMLLINLDGFKTINESAGHQVGNLVLAEAARRIRANSHAADTVGRLGGDEIVLLTKIEAPEDAGALARQLLRDLREVIAAGDYRLHISASIGIAVYPDDGTDQRALLRNADAATRHAKAAGRDTFCYFASSMTATALAHLELAEDLRAAFERSEFELYYQPKFDAYTRELCGAEALLRWHHPRRGLLAPDQFLGLAEKIGMTIPIGNWVLDEACAQLARWHAIGETQLTMAVNLSATQFCHPALLATVRAAVDRHGLAPQGLIVEVTESTAMHDVESSLAIMQQLDGMGVRISIDDFGTGYSSLLYLKRIPASELKIDRGFVHDLHQDTEDLAIITAIVALARTLDLKVVVEGVERVEQLAILRELGCDIVQGYLLGKPASSADFLHAGLLASSLPAVLRLP